MLTASATDSSGGPPPGGGGHLDAASADRPYIYTVALRRQFRIEEPDSIYGDVPATATEQTCITDRPITDLREALSDAVTAAEQHSADITVLVYRHEAGSDDNELVYCVYSDRHIEPVDSLSTTAATGRIGRMIRHMLAERQIPPRAALPQEIISCFQAIDPQDPDVIALGDLATASRLVWSEISRWIRAT